MAFCLCGCIPSGWAQALLEPDPDVPPAFARTDAPAPGPSLQNPVRVALVDSGVNYLLPEINRALARSADGQLIGYDFWDMDDKPFDAHPLKNGRLQRHGTQTASLLIREADSIALVPYRYPRPDMGRMSELLAHANSHGVRVMGLALGGNRRSEWEAFEAAAASYPHILFVASAGNNGRNIDQQPVYPASLTLSNLLVVSSADDFARPARGVNWGRTSVDYLVPAEHRRVLRFDGSEGFVSGSSYAVPRVVALAARWLERQPAMSASDLIARIRRQFGNGAAPEYVGQGYLYDPQLDADNPPRLRARRLWRAAENAPPSEAAPVIPIALEVLVLTDEWSEAQIDLALEEAQRILSQCGVQFTDVDILSVDAAQYLQDLATGSARTLLSHVRSSGSKRRIAIVFARDTRMSQSFDAEAFGEANTRSRPWLTNSVWLTLALRDRGIALAHELFHVLVNSGAHSEQPGNLMLARTSGSNRSLSDQQCRQLRKSGTRRH